MSNLRRDSKIRFFSLLFLLFLGVGAANSILFSSCSNLFTKKVTAAENQPQVEETKNENEQEQPQKVITPAETTSEPEPVTITGQMIINGALPEELLAQNIQQTQDESPDRSAIPTYNSSEVSYFAVATSGSKTVTGTFGSGANASTFTLTLIPNQNWTITCGIKKAGSSNTSANYLLTATSDPFDPADIGTNETLTFFPVPDISSGTGQIDLSVSFESSVNSVKLICSSADWPSSDDIVTVSENSATIKVLTGSTVESVASGQYEVMMAFYDGTNSLLYATVQNITVCNGLTTRAWIASGGDSPIDSSGTFNVTDAKIKTFASTNFYVGETGAANAIAANNSNSGTPKAPFLTLDKALSVIQSLVTASGADATREYTIHICGTVNNTSGTTVPEIGSTFNSKLTKLTIRGRIDAEHPPVIQNAQTSGRILNIETTVPVEIAGLTITGGKANGTTAPNGYGGGLYLSGTSTDVTLNNSIIEENSATLQGGGVYIADGAKLVMKGNSAIKNNELTKIQNSSLVTPETKVCGAGVFVAQGATFRMDNGTISGNAATDSGGGVYVRGDFTLNNGTITSNKRLHRSSDGHGDNDRTTNIELGIPGHFIMNGGTITSELEYGWNGAAVNIYLTSSDAVGTATFDMNGGSITGVYSRSGAVKIRGNDSNRTVLFNMNGGSITENHATSTSTSSDGYGGAVYVGDYCTFNMTGGEISGNEAKKNGGGVYIESGGAFNLGKSGSTSTVTIKNNTEGEGASAVTSNVYLLSAQVINVAGALSTSSEVGLTRTFSVLPLTTGYASTNSGTSPDAIFTSDAGYTITAGATGEAVFTSSGGKAYTAMDYIFTFTADKDTVKRGKFGYITITPTVKRKEANGNLTTLYYNPDDSSLYEDPDFTTMTGSVSVSWEGSLLCGSQTEYESLESEPGTGSNKFVIPALSYADDYTLYVSAQYMGVMHDTSFVVHCVEPVIDSGVSVTEVTTTTIFSGTSKIFNGRTLKFPVGNNKVLIACDHEVTQGEYEEHMVYYGIAADTTSKPRETNGIGDNYPVYSVCWYEAIMYCNLRSKAEKLTPVYYIMKDGVKITDVSQWIDEEGKLPGSKIAVYGGRYYYNDNASTSSVLDYTGSEDADGGIQMDLDANGWRLPTEAEWEFLARGGNVITDVVYSGTNTANQLTNYAWYKANSGDNGGSAENGGKTHPVKGKSPNGLGLYDMSGNVWELCWDWKTTSINSSTPQTGPVTGTNRIIRGGSYYEAADHCTVYGYSSVSPYTRGKQLGFRVVRSAN